VPSPGGASRAANNMDIENSSVVLATTHLERLNDVLRPDHGGVTDFLDAYIAANAAQRLQEHSCPLRPQEVSGRARATATVTPQLR
jgi:hypothetical protein